MFYIFLGCVAMETVFMGVYRVNYSIIRCLAPASAGQPVVQLCSRTWRVAAPSTTSGCFSSMGGRLPGVPAGGVWISEYEPHFGVPSCHVPSKRLPCRRKRRSEGCDVPAP